MGSRTAALDRVYQSGDVEFTKSFWNLTETTFVKVGVRSSRAFLCLDYCPLSMLGILFSTRFYRSMRTPFSCSVPSLIPYFSFRSLHANRRRFIFFVVWFVFSGLEIAEACTPSVLPKSDDRLLN